MKKTNLLILAAASLLGLAACGGTTPTESSKAPETTSQTPTPATSETPAPASSEAPAPATSEEPPVSTYTVTFKNGNKVVSTQQVKAGEKASKPENDPTKPGKDFAGWYNGDVAWDFENDVVTCDLTLSAKFVLSVANKLEQQIDPLSVNSDSECAVWTKDNFAVTCKSGHWYLNDSGADWRTMLVFDAEGRLCWGIWCPANGYGGPAAYTYCCNQIYSKAQQGYKNNPAFEIGENFASDSSDFKIVVPEGGFALTCINEDATYKNMIADAITGGEISDLSDAGGGRDFNATNAQWSNRTFKYNSDTNEIEVYCLATSISYTGSKSGVGVGDASTGDYNFEVTLYKGNTIKLYYDAGYGSLSFKMSDYDAVTGAYNATNDGENLFLNDPDEGETLVASKGGKYTFTYNVNANSLDIQYAPLSDEEASKLLTITVDAKNTSGSEIYFGEGTVLHDYENGWNATNTGSTWKSFFVFDSEGKLCYGCFNPNSGYGGPAGTAYNRHSDYADYTTNPCVEMLEGYKDWSTSDGDSCNKFKITVPTGGFALAIAGDTDDINGLASLLSGQKVNEFDDSYAVKGQLNQYYSVVETLRAHWDASRDEIYFTKEEKVVTALQAKVGQSTSALPSTYTHDDTAFSKSNLGDYTVAFDANGKVIYASCTADGYGGPADGFYHDGSYELKIGETCGIFQVDSKFQSWSDVGGERNVEVDGQYVGAWTLYTVQAPEGGMIVTGTALQMESICEAIFGVDITDYNNNDYFEGVATDGEVNSKKTTFAVNSEDSTVYDVTVE